MSYSSDAARLVGKQLAKFATSNPHQLAGQVANLEFWLGEVAHALKVIDNYGERFQRLQSAQKKHIGEHQTIEFSLDDPCCTTAAADPPRRVPDKEMSEARRYLCDAMYRFLVRCCNESMISEAELRAACARFDIGVESRDLHQQV